MYGPKLGEGRACLRANTWLTQPPLWALQPTVSSVESLWSQGETESGPSFRLQFATVLYQLAAWIEAL